MNAPATPVVDTTLLDELTACAGRFALAFGAAGDAAPTPAERAAAFDMFDRAFRAVRLGTLLKIRLDLQALKPRSAVETAPEDERADDCDTRPEIRADRLDSLDREGDRESVSLPDFLKTLGVVARDAAALGARLPPGLGPTAVKDLNGLLQRAAQPAAPPRRAQLSAGAATITLARPASQGRAVLRSALPSNALRRRPP